MISLKKAKMKNELKPYGVLLEPQSEEDTNLRYKYKGQERDTFTNYDYMHFRFYASSMGRFLKPDNIIPDITNPQNWNAYTYVKGNPVNFNDPSGHTEDQPLQQENKQNQPVGPTQPSTQNIEAMKTQEQKMTDQPKKVGLGDYKLTIPSDLKLDLVTAQNVVMFNEAGTVGKESFQPKNGQTYCNMATVFVAKAVGAPLGPLTDKSGTPLLANAIASNLSTSRKYFKVGPIIAQALANSGVLVIAAQSNLGGHGHVATVRAEKIPEDVIKGGSSGPLIANVGSSVGVKYAGGEDVIGKPAFRKEPEVQYYFPATSH